MIAIVDDDPFLRRLLRTWLERAGFSVCEHESGTDFLAADLSAIDLACLDLGFGEIDGIEVLRRLRAIDPDLPVIVTTADRSVETAVVAMRAGAFDYIGKPFEKPRLLGAIQQALSSSRRHR